MVSTGQSTETTIQKAVWQMELGGGKKVIRWILVVLVAMALSLVYTAQEFRGLEKRESMEMAQLARNIARGEGFITYSITPLSLWHLATHGPDQRPRLMNHPDIYNPPLYPLILAGIFKMLPASIFEYKPTDKIFAPERWVILPFNQYICLFGALIFTYLIARHVFDTRVAVTAGLLLLFSETLWNYSVSGLPTSLLILLLVVATYCLCLADNKLNPPDALPPDSEHSLQRRVSVTVISLVVLSGVVMGLCFLTLYLSAFLLLPMAIYVWMIHRNRAPALWTCVFVAIFLAVITPWLVRNYQVSGSALGMAKYDYLNRTSGFSGDIMHRSYHPNFENKLPLWALGSKTVRQISIFLTKSIKEIGSDYLIFFFGVGLMYSFRRRNAARLRGITVGGLICGMLGMAVIGGHYERSDPDINGGNLLILFLPFIVVFGVAFFYLLLDRIQFRMRLTRGLAIGVFALLNVSPMLLNLATGRTQAYYPYPPYVAPVTHGVAQYFEEDDLAASDLPWAMAWVGDRKTVWLPKTIEEFYELHDFVAPKGFSFVLFTPYMLNRPFQSGLMKGEYEPWAFLTRGKIPQDFPLKAATTLPPRNEQILLADRPRWADQSLNEPAGMKDDEPEEISADKKNKTEQHEAPNE